MRAGGLLAGGDAGLGLDGLRMRARKRGLAGRCRASARRRRRPRPWLAPGSAVAVTAAARTSDGEQRRRRSARAGRSASRAGGALAITPLTSALIDRARRRLSASLRPNARRDALRPPRRPPSCCSSTVRDFAAQEVAPVAEELDRDEGASPTRSWPRWASSGWMGIPFPEEFGGARRRRRSRTRWPSRSSRAWTRRVAITMCAHTSLGTQPIYLFGSQEQKERCCPSCARAPSSAPSA